MRTSAVAVAALTTFADAAVGEIAQAAHLTDGVQRELGRELKDFADYARRTASTGVWQVAGRAA